MTKKVGIFFPIMDSQWPELNLNKIHNFLWIRTSLGKILISSMKMEEYMESEFSGIFRLKLVAKNIVLGSPMTHFIHISVYLFLRKDVQHPRQCCAKERPWTHFSTDTKNWPFQLKLCYYSLFLVKVPNFPKSALFSSNFYQSTIIVRTKYPKYPKIDAFNKNK